MEDAAERRECCFSCTQGPKSLYVRVWDIRTGVVLRTFSCDGGCGGPGAASNTAALCLLRGSHLLCAPKNLPFIYIWNLNKEQVMLKIACAGLVRSLCCSPDGVYCAGAIAEKVYFWQVCTGNLLAVVCRHYQPINVVRFSDDGVHLVSGGEDCRVIVWRMVEVLSDAYTSSDHNLLRAPPPGLASSLTRHVWSDHSLPVTDIHCGHGGLRSKVVTVSLDQTCKVYEIVSGSLLCSILLDYGLTRVTLDLAEKWLFVGASNGKILEVNLQAKLLGLENPAEHQYSCFSGHSKAISGLAVATWAKVLVSTSNLEDTARVWDIASRQTIREVKHRGPVLKMLLSGSSLLPFSKQGEKTKPAKRSTTVKPFKKQLHYAQKVPGNGSGTPETGNRPNAVASIPIRLRGMDPLCDLSDLHYMESLHPPPPVVTTSSMLEKDLTLQAVRQQFHELKDVHQRMYSFIVDKVIPSDEGHCVSKQQELLPI